MTRRFDAAAWHRLVIASHNPGKLREIAELLQPFDVAVASAAELGLPEPEETGATFAENALIKARAAQLVDEALGRPSTGRRRTLSGTLCEFRGRTPSRTG